VVGNDFICICGHMNKFHMAEPMDNLEYLEWLLKKEEVNETRSAKIS
jgi:hypothetical protein